MADSLAKKAKKEKQMHDDPAKHRFRVLRIGIAMTVLVMLLQIFGVLENTEYKT